MAQISIIIPTMNRSRSLEKALISLSRQRFTGRKVEILIIDNGSTDDTKAVVRWFEKACLGPETRYFFEPIPGLLSGRHRGALEARGEILTFVDDDIEADAGWLEAIADAFSDETVQLVGGRNLPRFEIRPPVWLTAFRVPTKHGGWALGQLSLLDLGHENMDIDGDYVWGLNFSIRRRALFELGGFHPDCIPKHLQHFQGDGETGLTRKAKDRGYRAVYAAGALVRHNISRDRLSRAYFERRAFYQGVCDSFTDIRQGKPLAALPAEKEKNSPMVCLRANLRMLIRCAKHPIIPFLWVKDWIQSGGLGMKALLVWKVDSIRSCSVNAYKLGYRFHRNAVISNPELLQWVLKKDFWDFNLPNLKTSTILRHSQNPRT